MQIQIPTKFKPLFKPKRYKVFFGGRGGVKSWSFAQALEVIGAQERKRILCTREYQGSIQDSVHKLLSDTIDRLELNSFYTVQNTSIRGQNKTEFLFAGLKNNPTQIKSTEGIDIVWVEEAESISDRSWDILIPTIRKKCSEIWISFNPDDAEDPTYTRFVAPYLDAIEKDGYYEDDHIYVCYVGYWDNPWFPDELRHEMEACKKNDPKKYDHIWLGKPDAQNEGAYYADMMKKAREENRICSIPIDPSVPVNTFWDLGRNDSTAIWFHQQVGKEHRFVDHYEMSGEGLQHYARILKEKEYFYGKHYLPHDVEVTELTTNKSRKRTLEDLGVKPLVTVKRVKDINEGIEMTRQKIPMCYFDENRCKDGIRALTKYHKEWDDKRQVYRSYPLHDWSSNSADAFRQFAQGYKEDSHRGWDKPIEAEVYIV